MTKTCLFLSLLLLSPAFAVAQSNFANLRTGRPDPQIRLVPASVQQQAFANPEEYVDDLVRALVAGVNDRGRRVKILHDWIATHIAYDVEAYFKNEKIDTAWEATLHRRKNVCAGYADLFTKMCELASVPCRSVTGYGRGYRFLANDGNVDVSQSNHAWNAVYLDGQWRLLDVGWDAGHVTGRKFTHDFSHTYFLLAPEQFIFTHYPQEAKWQLLKRSMSSSQFSNLPYLKGAFFEYGLEMQSPLRRVNRVGSSTWFNLNVPASTMLMAKLEDSSNNEQTRRTFVRRTSKTGQVLVTFPRPGNWDLKLFAKRQGDPGALTMVASLKFAVSAHTNQIFPESYAAWYDMRGFLYSPVYVPLKPDRDQTFEVRLHDAAEVFLLVGDRQWQELELDESKNVYSLTTQVPTNERVRLTAKKRGGEKYTTLIDFTPDRR